MKTITILVEFNISGHGAINVIPSSFGQWMPVQTSSNTYDLPPGTYTITYLTATQGGGKIEVSDNTGVLASFPLAIGVDGGNFTIVV
jgi:hypothetical protein